RGDEAEAAAERLATGAAEEGPGLQVQLHPTLADVLLHDLRQVVDLEALADRALDVDEHLHLDRRGGPAENEALLGNPLEQVVRRGGAVQGAGPRSAAGGR